MGFNSAFKGLNGTYFPNYHHFALITAIIS